MSTFLNNLSKELGFTPEYFAKRKEFDEQCGKILHGVLKEFSQKGLLPDINTVWHEPHWLAKDIHRINFIGTNGTSGLDADDTQGIKIAQEIAKAAKSQGINVVSGTELGSHITSEGPYEHAPRMHLLALDAYAEEKGHPELAKLARKAAMEVTGLETDVERLRPRAGSGKSR